MTDISFADLDIPESMAGTPPPSEVTLSEMVGGYSPTLAKAKYMAKAGVLQAQYYADKLIGKRRITGAANLRRLTARHRRIIAMHLEGLTSNEIAYTLCCTATTISRILHDPLVCGLLSAHNSVIDKELEAMAPMAAQAIRSAMESTDHKIALQAVDRWAKITGRGQPVAVGSITNNLNLKIEGARDKMLESLAAAGLIEVPTEKKEEAEAPVTIDITPTEPATAPASEGSFPC